MVELMYLGRCEVLPAHLPELVVPETENISGESEESMFFLSLFVFLFFLLLLFFRSFVIFDFFAWSNEPGILLAVLCFFERAEGFTMYYDHEEFSKTGIGPLACAHKLSVGTASQTTNQPKRFKQWAKL